VQLPETKGPSYRGFEELTCQYPSQVSIVSRNKLIMIASMMLTIVVVTTWLGDNKPSKGTRALSDADSVISSTGGECPSVSELVMQNPDAIPNEMIEVEECNREMLEKQR
jgi:hypothetical protein